MSGSRQLRVAYLTTMFPGVSHTFVQREVAALRARAVTVDTVSVHRAPPSEILSLADAESARTTAALLPTSLGRLVRSHGWALLRAPRAYVATLVGAQAYAAPGLRGRVWQLFYFAEAMLLWAVCQRQGVRHVHAHFANNAADIARLVTDYGSAADSRPWSWSFTMHGPTEFAEIRQYGLAGKVEHAAFVACISDFARSQLMALVDETQWDKLGIVHCGVDPDHFVVPDRAAHDEGRMRVLCVGRLVPEKGQAVLLEAVEQLQRRGVAVELRLVGEGPSRAALEREVARRRLAEVVQLVGAVGQDEILAAYAWADVFCLPSFAEGVPVVLMEAMSTELPVVTTRIAGIPELVEDGLTGIVVAPGRADDVAEALHRLAKDAELRRTYGAAARRRVEEHFRSSTAVEPLVELFASRAPGAGPDR